MSLLLNSRRREALDQQLNQPNNNNNGDYSMVGGGLNDYLSADQRYHTHSPSLAQQQQQQHHLLASSGLQQQQSSQHNSHDSYLNMLDHRAPYNSSNSSSSNSLNSHQDRSLSNDRFASTDFIPHNSSSLIQYDHDDDTTIIPRGGSGASNHHGLPPFGSNNPHAQISPKPLSQTIQQQQQQHEQRYSGGSKMDNMHDLQQQAMKYGQQPSSYNINGKDFSFTVPSNDALPPYGSSRDYLDSLDHPYQSPNSAQSDSILQMNGHLNRLSVQSPHSSLSAHSMSSTNRSTVESSINRFSGMSDSGINSLNLNRASFSASNSGMSSLSANELGWIKEEIERQQRDSFGQSQMQHQQQQQQQQVHQQMNSQSMNSGNNVNVNQGNGTGSGSNSAPGSNRNSVNPHEGNALNLGGSNNGNGSMPSPVGMYEQNALLNLAPGSSQGMNLLAGGSGIMDETKLKKYKTVMCLLFGNAVTKADGSHVAVEHIKIGDLLQGQDGRIVRVTENDLSRTCDEAYKITLTNGEFYTVTSDHLVTLSTIEPKSQRAQLYEIEVRELYHQSPADRSMARMNAPLKTMDDEEVRKRFATVPDTVCTLEMPIDITSMPNESPADLVVELGMNDAICRRWSQTVERSPAGFEYYTSSPSKIVYLTYEPLQSHAQTIDAMAQIATSTSQLERVWSLLRTFDANIRLTHIGTECGPTTDMARTRSRYDALLTSDMLSQLRHLDTTVIVASGKVACDRWRRADKYVPELIRIADHTSTSHARAKFTTWQYQQRTITVYYAPHAMCWEEYDTLLDAVASAEELVSNTPVTIPSSWSTDLGITQPIAHVELLPQSHGDGFPFAQLNVMSIQPQGHAGDRRFVLSNGILTHNCQRMVRTGGCRYGALCDFAHDRHELRRNLDLHWYFAVKCEKRGCIDPECRYSHNDHEVMYHPRIYKTRLCTNYVKPGGCLRKCYCSFAHGKFELRLHTNTNMMMGGPNNIFGLVPPQPGVAPSLAPSPPPMATPGQGQITNSASSGSNNNNNINGMANTTAPNNNVNSNGTTLTIQGGSQVLPRELVASLQASGISIAAAAANDSNSSQPPSSSQQSSIQSSPQSGSSQPTYNPHRGSTGLLGLGPIPSSSTSGSNAALNKNQRGGQPYSSSPRPSPPPSSLIQDVPPVNNFALHDSLRDGAGSPHLPEMSTPYASLGLGAAAAAAAAAISAEEQADRENFRESTDHLKIRILDLVDEVALAHYQRAMDEQAAAMANGATFRALTDNLHQTNVQLTAAKNALGIYSGDEAAIASLSVSALDNLTSTLHGILSAISHAKSKLESTPSPSPSSPTVCLICQSEPVTNMVWPCAHRVVCSSCHPDNCPSCQSIAVRLVPLVNDLPNVTSILHTPTSSPSSGASNVTRPPTECRMIESRSPSVASISSPSEKKNSSPSSPPVPAMVGANAP